jgi:hypothetical protein
MFNVMVGMYLPSSIGLSLNIYMYRRMNMFIHDQTVYSFMAYDFSYWYVKEFFGG